MSHKQAKRVRSFFNPTDLLAKRSYDGVRNTDRRVPFLFMDEKALIREGVIHTRTVRLSADHARSQYRVAKAALGAGA